MGNGKKYRIKEIKIKEKLVECEKKVMRHKPVRSVVELEIQPFGTSVIALLYWVAIMALLSSYNNSCV